MSIFSPTAVLRLLVRKLAKANPVWAISFMVVVTSDLMKQAMLFLRSRIINTLVACAVGLQENCGISLTTADLATSKQFA